MLFFPPSSFALFTYYATTKRRSSNNGTLISMICKKIEFFVLASDKYIIITFLYHNIFAMPVRDAIKWTKYFRNRGTIAISTEIWIIKSELHLICCNDSKLEASYRTWSKREQKNRRNNITFITEPFKDAASMEMQCILHWNCLISFE